MQRAQHEAAEAAPGEEDEHGWNVNDAVYGYGEQQQQQQQPEAGELADCNWSQYQDDQGYAYYYNHVTEESTYDEPAEPYVSCSGTVVTGSGWQEHQQDHAAVIAAAAEEEHGDDAVIDEYATRIAAPAEVELELPVQAAAAAGGDGEEDDAGKAQRSRRSKSKSKSKSKRSKTHKKHRRRTKQQDVAVVGAGVGAGTAGQDVSGEEVVVKQQQVDADADTAGDSDKDSGAAAVAVPVNGLDAIGVVGTDQQQGGAAEEAESDPEEEGLLTGTGPAPLVFAVFRWQSMCHAVVCEAPAAAVEAAICAPLCLVAGVLAALLALKSRRYLAVAGMWLREAFIYSICVPSLLIPGVVLTCYTDFNAEEDWDMTPLWTLFGGVDPRRFIILRSGNGSYAENVHIRHTPTEYKLDDVCGLPVPKATAGTRRGGGAGAGAGVASGAGDRGGGGHMPVSRREQPVHDGSSSYDSGEDYGDAGIASSDDDDVMVTV